MFELNNKGFGLAVFLFFIGLLLLALIVVAVMSYSAGLSNNKVPNNITDCQDRDNMG